MSRHWKLLALFPFVAVGSLVAAREVETPAAAAPSTMAEMIQVQSQFVLYSNADMLEAREGTPSGYGVKPFDGVVLRRQVGVQTVDCGTFGQPHLVDNGLIRHWIYRMKRPRSGQCASVTGARFTAVGKKGNTERSTANVP